MLLVWNSCRSTATVLLEYDSLFKRSTVHMLKASKVNLGVVLGAKAGLLLGRSYL